MTTELSGLNYFFGLVGKIGWNLTNWEFGQKFMTFINFLVAYDIIKYYGNFIGICNVHMAIKWCLWSHVL